MSEKHYYGDVGEVEYVRLKQPNMSSETYYTKEYVEKLQQRIAELEEQLKNAIVLPKNLQVGNKIFWANEDGVYSGKVCSITKDENPRGGFNIWFYCIYDNGLTFWHLLKDFNSKVFITKEEAQAKLKELKGE